MKLSRKTKIRIRKGATFARSLFLALFGICTMLTICSIDSESLKFPFICFAIGVICFGISYVLDRLLFETAWSGDKKSHFTH